MISILKPHFTVKSFNDSNTVISRHKVPGNFAMSVRLPRMVSQRYVLGKIKNWDWKNQSKKPGQVAT